jgi:hypothetical protein
MSVSKHGIIKTKYELCFELFRKLDLLKYNTKWLNQYRFIFLYLKKMIKYFISFSNRIFKYKKIFKCIVLIIINICLFFEVIKKYYLTLKNKISTRNIKVCLWIMGKEEN